MSYWCSHTVCKYLRHTAKWVVALISLQMLMQVVASRSFAPSMSGDVTANTFRVFYPYLETGEGFYRRVLVCQYAVRA